MADEEGAETAIDKLNGEEIDGQEVKVEKARPRYKLEIYLGILLFLGQA